GGGGGGEAWRFRSSTRSLAVRGDAGVDLGAALLHEALGDASPPEALGDVHDRAVDHRVGEALSVGAALREAVGDAAQAEAAAVEALEGAGHHLDAGVHGGARAAVHRAVGAGLVGPLARAVAADRAEPAVLPAGGAGLVAHADAVAAAHALAAVL